ATFGERHRDEVGYHAWLQWLLEEQRAAVPSTPGGLGVLNDLAIGFAPNGFDAWSFQDELAAGISVGAPPDPLGPPRPHARLPSDLSVCFAPNGCDAWSFQDELAAGISVGAPPDPLGPHGKDWGLPAFV